MVASGVRAYIQRTFSLRQNAVVVTLVLVISKIAKQFTRGTYMRLSNPDDFALYMSAPNRAKSVLRLTQTLSSIETIKVFL